MTKYENESGGGPKRLGDQARTRTEQVKSRWVKSMGVERMMRRHEVVLRKALSLVEAVTRTRS